MPRFNRQIRVPALVRRIPPKAIAVGIAAVFVAINVAVPSSGERAGQPMAPAALDAWFDDAVHDAGIPGAAIVVVQNGRIVHEHGVGVADDSGRRVTAQTPFVIGSLANQPGIEHHCVGTESGTTEK